MTEDRPVDIEDTRSDEEILYARVKKYARAAFIACIALVALAVLDAAGRLLSPYYRTGLVQGELSASDVWNILFSVLRGGPVSALMVAGIALIALLVARAALDDRRPSWAPVLTDAFIRKADIFVLVTFAFACIYALTSLFTISATVHQMAWMSGQRMMEAIIFATAGSLQSLLRAVFATLLGGFVIRALLLVAVKEPGSADRSEKGGRRE